MKSLITTLVLLIAPAMAWAHGLNVFASVSSGEVIVETKFTSGRTPVSGAVQVFDAENVLLLETELGEDGTVRFPLTEAAAGGLTIEVQAGGHHEGYWVLTPADIAAGEGS